MICPLVSFSVLFLPVAVAACLMAVADAVGWPCNKHQPAQCASLRLGTQRRYGIAVGIVAVQLLLLAAWTVEHGNGSSPSMRDNVHCDNCAVIGAHYPNKAGGGQCFFQMVQRVVGVVMRK